MLTILLAIIILVLIFLRIKDQKYINNLTLDYEEVCDELETYKAASEELEEMVRDLKK